MAKAPFGLAGNIPRPSLSGEASLRRPRTTLWLGGEYSPPFVERCLASRRAICRTRLGGEYSPPFVERQR